MIRITPTRALLGIAFAMLSAPALADGKAFAYDRNGLYPLREDEQAALIHHSDGRQRMRLAVRIESADPARDGARAVWLFPVRGRGDALRIELRDEFSMLKGVDVVAEARDRIRSVSRFAAMWAILPAVCLLPSLGGVGGDLASAGGLQVTNAIERFGMRAEVLAVDSAAALLAHLETAGVRAEAAALSSFEPYFNPDHSLIAVWIASPADFDRAFREKRTNSRTNAFGRSYATPCVEVEFPTPQPWFPLRPSFDARGGDVSLRLQISGRWRIPAPLAAADPARRWFRQTCTSRVIGAAHAAFFEQSIGAKEMLFSSLSASVSADSFLRDIEFEPETEPRVSRSLWLADRPLWFVVACAFTCIALLSLLAGGVSGLMIARMPIAGAWLGLANLGTIVALLLALRRTAWLSKVRPDGTTPLAQRGAYVAIFLGFYLAEVYALEAWAEGW